MEGLPDCYLFRLNDEFDVDATTCGNAARFINHCCDPNLETTVVTYRSQNHIVFRGLSLSQDFWLSFETVGQQDSHHYPCSKS